jgi:hypothetical protein
MTSFDLHSPFGHLPSLPRLWSQSLHGIGSTGIWFVIQLPFTHLPFTVVSPHSSHFSDGMTIGGGTSGACLQPTAFANITTPPSMQIAFLILIM